ncbi:MAG: hypothetical protein KF871_06840 [Hydrogenophaga sp.]|uniref:hypothetical protein n=1 Tax=Hydrogenophaga sp. TaxID=1904254 RepID=UPI001D6AAC6F|nr:hypothetical protein [Hydrogenophaga sp.]MBX3609598.1 hypothetical protein [Hydrogenophaga sp.]
MQNTESISTEEIAPKDYSLRFGLGWGLVALAFVVRLLFARDALESFAYALGSVVGAVMIYGGIVWLIVRKRSERAKANGVLILGLLVLGAAASSGGSAYNEQALAKAYIGDLKVLYGKAIQRFDDHDSVTLALHQKLLSFDVKYLLTSAGRTEATQVINAYEARLSQRETMLEQLSVEARTLMGTLPQRLQSKAQVQFDTGYRRTQETVQPVISAQRELLASYRKLVDWLSRQNGLSVDAQGQLVTRTRLQRIQFDDIVLPLEQQIGVLVTAATEAEQFANANDAQIKAIFEKFAPD